LEHLCAENHDGAQGASADKPKLSDAIGGQDNAYTAKDHTCYYISASSDRMSQCIDYIAAQVADANITRKDFEREHGVVQRELEMGLDDPDRVLFYTHEADFYGRHPAAVPTIGYLAPLAAVSYEDVLAYHARMYVPQNMVFVVAGDIDPAKAVADVIKKFGDFQAGRQPAPVLPPVEPLTSVRRFIRPNEQFQEVAEIIGFQTVPITDRDLYALDVLSYILSNGKASRLVEHVQFRQKFVTSVETWSDTPAWGGGEFAVAFRCTPGMEDKAEKAIIDQLRRISKTKVSAEELRRAKMQKISDYVNAQQDVFSIASSLGCDMLLTGDMNFSKNYTDRIQKVTAAQVRQVARKYFNFNRMVVTRIVPRKVFNAAKADAAAGGSSAAEIVTLPNGLRVVLCESHDVPLVAMAFACRGGILNETAKTDGLGLMMSVLSTRGAGDMTGSEIAAFFNSAGGTISAIAGDNSYLYSAEVMSDKFGKALDIFADVVLRPTFPQKELDSVKPLLIADIRRSDENWVQLLMKKHRGDFYAPATPWSLPNSGYEEVIKSATRKMLEDYHKKYILAGESVLAIYGDFDAKNAAAKVRKLFGDMPAGSTSLPAVPVKREISASDETHVYSVPIQQAGIIVAANGPTVKNVEDRLPLMLLDTIISGYKYPCGWLHDQLRGRQLVYVIHATQKNGFLPGAFLAYAGTQPEKAQQVIDIIKANFQKAADYTPTRQELDLAANKIITSELLENQSLGSLATGAAMNVLYGLGVDWPKTLEKKIRSITPQQVRDTAQKYLAGGYVVTVITPKPAAVKK
ncbi:MAG TPA: pitrilysin family protein, partial [Phycisphaerae bacterium]|nr:pitrilysin family protein [Phycisphaerae bacterium]